MFWPVSYLALRPLVDYAYPRIQMEGLSPVMSFELQRQSLFCFVAVFSITLGASKMFHVEHLKLSMLGLALLDALLLPFNYGLLGNSAQDACFVGLALFLVEGLPKKQKLGCLIIMLVSICLSMSATGALVMFIFFCSTYWTIALLGVGLLGFVTYLFPAFWIDNGRLVYWQQAIDFLKIGDLPFGVGPGSYFVYGPAMSFKVRDVAFAWLHNDYLEILFGYGVCGLLSFGILIGVLVFESRRRYRYLCLIAAFLTVMMFQMPLEQPLFWGLIILFLRMHDEREDFLLQRS